MRPLLLDLFCGAGGAAVGYYRAGFDIIGVDIAAQPNYPFLWRMGDALTQGEWIIHNYPVTAIHASPPCQAHTTMSNRWRGKSSHADTHSDLIPQTREWLEIWGLPWVIENVVGARSSMRNPITLHGGMFGLGVHRPRLFETSIQIAAPPARAPVVNPIGVYGKMDGRRLMTRKDKSILRAAKNLEEARAAMGIDWMEWRELAESIPPAYTEYIGRQIIGLRGERAA